MEIRFASTRFGPGYDPQEVDDFIDRCERAVRSGDGSVTARQVAEKRFTATRFREGYDMDEVDRFLDDVLVPLLGNPAQPSDAPQQEVTGSALHPAERRPGFLARLFGGGR